MKLQQVFSIFAFAAVTTCMILNVMYYYYEGISFFSSSGSQRVLRSRSIITPSRTQLVIFHVIPPLIDSDFETLKEAINDVIAAEATRGDLVLRVWVFHHPFNGDLMYKITAYLDTLLETHFAIDVDLNSYSLLPLITEGYEWKDPLHYYVKRGANKDTVTKRSNAIYEVYTKKMSYVENFLEDEIETKVNFIHRLTVSISKNIIYL
jgi:hypothetical protein